MPLGMRSPLANTRNAQYILLRQRAYLQQIVHQTTHSLARFFLEVDANYKQFKTASRLRAAAAQRLEAQRAYYEEGRITIDRFLDAVSQYAQAVAQEAQFKTTYNISIVALEEAKGTLLAYNNIAVAEGPHPRKAYVQARDIQDAHRKLPIPHDGPMYRQRVTGPLNPDPVPANPPPDVQPGEPSAAAGPCRPARPTAHARCRRTAPRARHPSSRRIRYSPCPAMPPPRRWTGPPAWPETGLRSTGPRLLPAEHQPPWAARRRRPCRRTSGQARDPSKPSSRQLAARPRPGTSPGTYCGRDQAPNRGRTTRTAGGDRPASSAQVT